jgi:phospholipid-binding lipoprotein MlaA
MMLQSSRRVLLMVVVLLCSGCATTGPDGVENIDPFERTNRAIYRFNDGLDRTILKPVAKGYRKVTPAFLRRGVGNFFANLYDLNGAVNALLQARIPEAGRNTWRFILNTTAGLLGFIDVATPAGVEPYRTDFGHTLSIWGADSGAYLMVPFFGPRTVRSGVGSLFDTVASVQWQLDRKTAYALFALEVIDARAALTDAEELITGDRYIFIRDAYLQQREYFVNEGVVEDSFGDDVDDDFDWE